MDFLDFIKEEKEALDEMSFANVYGRMGNQAKKLMKDTAKKMDCSDHEACLALAEMYKKMVEQGIK